ncbi:LysR family transcriptional regulator [Tateyamaria sp. SN6-1]|uniref:LysR family transcriptional regulator n=1 Tax=Tateyamaria sp. SN6-1 TaxID=3092148 RepID=UPI0039F631D8
MNLEHLRLFKSIVQFGSLASAARDLGLSSTTVSEKLAALERDMGTVLLNRTTRSLSLTEAGQTLLEGLEPLLEEADSLAAQIKLGSDALAGTIRVSAPNDLGRTRVSDIIKSFVTQNPAVSVELLLSDGYVDIVGDGFDIALRFGALPDGTLRTRKLGTAPRIVCASPDYIARHGTPSSPEDLQDHQCLLMRFGKMLDRQWHFGEGDTATSVMVDGKLISNDGHLVRQWCLDGLGIALKSKYDVADDIKAGRLIPLLQDFAAPGTDLQMLFPPHARNPPEPKLWLTRWPRGFDDICGKGV